MQSRRISQPEFVTILAILFATLAFSIDAMLPALPQIAMELSPDDVNRAQLVVTSFVFGMGMGTFVAGPISDAIGRKFTISLGLGLYILGAVLAYLAPSLEMLLAARVLQGLGAAAPRIVTLAMVRDLYEGREMARITSFVMMVFLLMPAAAPAIGSLIIDAFSWHAIFLGFVLFALFGGTWMNVRQPETLPPERRRPLRAAIILSGLREIFADRRVMIYTLVLTLGFGQMMAMVATTQPIYDEIFGKADTFPAWFALTALLSSTGTIVNAALVMRLGMRRLAIAAYTMQVVISLGLFVLTVSGLMPAGLAFPAFFLWSVSVFLMAGLTFGNLNALALAPLGHIAGLAASMIGAISTVLGAAIASVVGLVFNGTIIPLLIGTLFCSAGAWILMRIAGVPEDDEAAQPAQ